MNDKFRIVDFHQMAGLTMAFRSPQTAALQRCRPGWLYTQAADVVRDVVRSAKQRDNLIHRYARPDHKRAVLRQAGLVPPPAVVIEMAFDFHNVAGTCFQSPFLPSGSSCQSGGSDTGVTVVLLFASAKTGFCFGNVGVNGFPPARFARFQRAFRIFKMAVGVGADDNQFNLWSFKTSSRSLVKWIWNTAGLSSGFARRR